MVRKPLPMLKKYGKFLNFSLYFADISLVVLAFCLAHLVTTSNTLLHGDFSGIALPLTLVAFIPAIIAIQTLFFFLTRVYTPRRDQSLYAEQSSIVNAVLPSVILSTGIAALIPPLRATWVLGVVYLLLAVSFILVWRTGIRLFLRTIRRKGYNQRHVLVIGAGRNGRTVLREMEQNPWLGLNVVGFIDDGFQVGQKIDGVCVIGHVSDLCNIVRSRTIDQVYIALPAKKFDVVEEVINSLRDEIVSVRVLPELCVRGQAEDYTLETIASLPMYSINSTPLECLSGVIMKRALDIVFSAFAIALFSPLFLLLPLLIKASSPGPVFFKQERIGQDGKRFKMLKFRTMKVSTVTEADELKAAGSATAMFTKADDPRKTQLGSFLRKTSLDEIPQFLNVLLGDMSVVGPRPERPLIVEQLKDEIPRYAQRHKIKTGITGWAQVNGWRGNTSLHKRIECDIYYIKHWSLLFDLKIMFLTFIKGFINKNAY